MWGNYITRRYTINYTLTKQDLSIIIFYMEISQVIELRLRISDPHGYINVVSVDELPDRPSAQTAYRIDEDVYVDSNGEAIELYLSDSRLWAWVEIYGQDATECVAYKAIAARLGGTMRLKRLTSGTENTEWQSIKELHDYYRQLSDDCTAQNAKKNGTNTGRFGSTKAPVIGGGDL